jgi:hypothetical protein
VRAFARRLWKRPYEEADTTAPATVVASASPSAAASTSVAASTSASAAAFAAGGGSHAGAVDRIVIMIALVAVDVVVFVVAAIVVLFSMRRPAIRSAFGVACGASAAFAVGRFASAEHERLVAHRIRLLRADEPV